MTHSTLLVTALSSVLTLGDPAPSWNLCPVCLAPHSKHVRGTTTAALDTQSLSTIWGVC